MFKIEAAAAITSFFLERAKGRTLNDLVLMKLLYLAERLTLERANYSLTGDSFASLSKGPVLRSVLDLMTDHTRSDLWSSHFEWLPKKITGQSNAVRLREPFTDFGELSEFDLRTLEEVWNKYGHKTKWTLVDLTHEFPEWNKMAEVANTSIPIPVEDILRKGFRETEERAEERARDIKYYQGIPA